MSKPNTNPWDNRQAHNLKRSNPIHTIIKQLIKDRDGNHCQKCGSHINIEVHHILPFDKYPRLQGVLENLICLCRDCHEEYHRTHRFWSAWTLKKFLGKSTFIIPKEIREIEPDVMEIEA